MVGDGVRKALIKTLDQAFNNALPGTLSIPLSGPLLETLEQFKTENNTDERLEYFFDSAFHNDLFQLCSKVSAKNKKNQIPFIYILAHLSPFMLNFNSFLFWVNYCLTNALNSPGQANELVLVSRSFLKNSLTVNHRLMGNHDSKSYQKLNQLRHRNACYLFKILLNIYFRNDLNFYQKDRMISINVLEDLEITTKSIMLDESVNAQEDKQSNTEENIRLLESHEAKRFVNLNIRTLLIEFMIHDAKTGFEILDDYIKDSSLRLETLGLIMNLLNQQANVMNFEILKSDANNTLKQNEQSYLQSLVKAIVDLDSENHLDITSEELKSKIINIYQKTQSNSKFKIDIRRISQTKLFQSLCNCLLYDNDVIVINYALLILVTIIPGFINKLNKLLPLLLMVYARIITFNRNLQLFVSFQYAELQGKLAPFYSEFMDTSSATNFEQLQNIDNAIAQEFLDVSERYNSPKLLNNQGLKEWTVIYKNMNGGVFEYKNCSKLYTVLYGLFPNSTVGFLRLPLEFFNLHFGMDLRDYIEPEHLSIFDDADILQNSKSIAINHLFNNDLLNCTTKDEIEGNHKLRWYNIYDENNSSELLWDCLKFDRNVSLEFYYPPDNIINQNILKIFFNNVGKEIVSLKKLDSVNELFKLINLYKVELYGYDLGKNNNIGHSPLTMASVPFSNFGSPNFESINRQPSIFSKNYSLTNYSKARKHSVVSSTSESIKESIENGGPSDIMSILNKQAQLFSRDADDLDNKSQSLLDPHNKTSPTIPSSNLNSPKFLPLDPDSANLHTENVRSLAPPLSASSQHPQVVTLNTSDELTKLHNEVLELNESLKYYKRELLLIGNDMEFTNLIRLMTNSELEKLKKAKFTGFLNNTETNKLELLKHEYFKSQRDHIEDSFKKISREYSITLSRKKKNDAVNLSKIKELRDENVALSAEIKKATKLIEDKTKTIEEFKKIFNEKDTFIINLRNTIKHLKSQQNTI